MGVGKRGKEAGRMEVALLKGGGRARGSGVGEKGEEGALEKGGRNAGGRGVKERGRSAEGKGRWGRGKTRERVWAKWGRRRVGGKGR